MSGVSVDLKLNEPITPETILEFARDPARYQAILDAIAEAKRRVPDVEAREAAVFEREKNAASALAEGNAMREKYEAKTAKLKEIMARPVD